MSHSMGSTVDCKGFPAVKLKTGGWIPAALILGIEFCERLSTMGIVANLVTYLIGTMHLPSATSANIVTDFIGTSFLLCLIGGFVADTFLGRYKTIAVFSIVETLGTGMLAMSTKLPQLRPPSCHVNKVSMCEKASSFQMAMLYISLYVTAVGIGGLKSSVSGFATDQFDEKDEKEKAQMNYFFNRFLFFISIGALLSVTVLVYIQDEVGRSWGYGICSISMFIAVLIFLSGTKRYRYRHNVGSPILYSLQVIVAATRKRNLQIPTSPCMLYEDCPESSQIHHTDQFRFLDKAAIITKEHFGTDTSLPPDHWTLCSVTRVEEVKMMIRLLPIWATTILFWTTYAQMMTFSVQQASTMKRFVGDFQVPAGSLTAFIVIAILLTLAVYDRLIMPLWKRWTGKPGFTNLQRIGIGLVLSMMGMVAAAIIEANRLSVARTAGRTTSPLPLSVFSLLPQFILVGAGEAFIYSGQLDFFITQSPKGMKTMSTGLFLTTLALGFFVSSLLVSVVKRVTTINGGHGWVGDNINYGRLDCFYGLLAILSFINFGLYLICATWYKPQIANKEPLVEGFPTESTVG